MRGETTGKKGGEWCEALQAESDDRRSNMQKHFHSSRTAHHPWAHRRLLFRPSASLFHPPNTSAKQTRTETTAHPLASVQHRGQALVVLGRSDLPVGGAMCLRGSCCPFVAYVLRDRRHTDSGGLHALIRAGRLQGPAEDGGCGVCHAGNRWWSACT